MSKPEKFDPYKPARPDPPKDEKGILWWAYHLGLFILGWKIYDWIKAYFDF